LIQLAARWDIFPLIIKNEVEWKTGLEMGCRSNETRFITGPKPPASMLGKISKQASQATGIPEVCH